MFCWVCEVYEWFGLVDCYCSCFCAVCVAGEVLGVGSVSISAFSQVCEVCFEAVEACVVGGVDFGGGYGAVVDADFV